MAHILLSRSILDQKNIQEVCQNYLSQHDHVVIILYSFFDMHIPNKHAYESYYEANGLYDQKMRHMFLSYGITKISYIHFYDSNHEAKKNLIKKATVLYFPGGAPDLMLKRLKDHGLTEAITSFKGHTIGSSAGAMIHFERTHIYKDKEYRSFKWLEGLNFIKDFDISVHYRRRIQQKKALRKVRRENQLKTYVIPDDSAIIVDHDKVICIGNARLFSTTKGVIK
jgi:peptidase E